MRLPHFVVSNSLPDKRRRLTKELSCSKNKKLVAVFNHNLHVKDLTTKVEGGYPCCLKSIAICRTDVRRRRIRDGWNRTPTPSDRRRPTAKTKLLRRSRNIRKAVWVHHPDASRRRRRTRPTSPTTRATVRQREECASHTIYEGALILSSRRRSMTNLRKHAARSLASKRCRLPRPEGVPCPSCP